MASYAGAEETRLPPLKASPTPVKFLANTTLSLFVTLLCIRPATFGFDQVEIVPMPGHLTHLPGGMVHPRGRIVADLHFADGQVRDTATLPVELHGTFCYVGKTVALRAGAQSIVL